MIDWLLKLDLISGAMRNGALIVSLLLTLATVAAIVVTRRRSAWRPLVVATGVGVVVAVGVYVLAKYLDTLNFFDGPLPPRAAVWGAAGIGLAAAGIAAAVGGPWWRRVLAILLSLAALLTAGLGVNQAYGVTPTLASLLGVQTVAAAKLPDIVPEEPSGTTVTPVDENPATLYARWVAPADMPAKGTVSALSGAAQIPSSGFAARDGALYLPPAALVPNPPKLPILVFMMGQPGSPDAWAVQNALDAFAAAHRGLAPIAIIADQISRVNWDPACHDSTTYGSVSTYFNVDIPAFITEHLNVVPDRHYWVIGGYSNGGACAIAWGAEHPEIWGGVMDVSGNEYPGSEHVKDTIAKVFAGDSAAFKAAMPKAQLAAHPGAYAGHLAAFTWGAGDGMFGPGQKSNAALATAAGFTVYTNVIPGASHIGIALPAGLDAAVADLAPGLGLAPPAG